MSATIRVKLDVEVVLSSQWGDDCSVGQVREQGEREAENALRRLLKDTGVNVIGVTTSDMVVRRSKP